MTEFKPNDTMLQNYIQNKLSPIDTEQLELWLADHPDVMQELELDFMLFQADFDPSTQNETTQKPSFSIWIFFASKKLVPINVLAYGLALMFVFNTFLNTNTSSNYSSATFIELEKVRGNETKIMEYNHPKENALTIRFFPDSEDGLYKVIMKSESQTKEFVFENLKVDEYGSISFSLANENKLAGEWEVLVYKNINQLEQQYIINLVL